jgi:hypothetical protein
MRCASGNPCTWIPDDRLSFSIQFTTTTPQLRRHPWHVKDPSRIIGQVRTRMWRARYGRREPSPPGTGTVAFPSPCNARAIAARKGRSPPCLRGAAGRSSAAINFQVICLASRSLTPGCLQAPLASSLDSVHQPCIAANSLQLMHAVGTAVLSNKIRKKTSSSKLRVLFQEIEWMVVATLIFPGKVTNDVGRDGTLHELMYPVHRFI